MCCPLPEVHRVRRIEDIVLDSVVNLGIVDLLRAAPGANLSPSATKGGHHKGIVLHEMMASVAIHLPLVLHAE